MKPRTRQRIALGLWVSFVVLILLCWAHLEAQRIHGTYAGSSGINYSSLVRRLEEVKTSPDPIVGVVGTAHGYNPLEANNPMESLDYNRRTHTLIYRFSGQPMRTWKAWFVSEEELHQMDDNNIAPAEFQQNRVWWLRFAVTGPIQLLLLLCGGTVLLLWDWVRMRRYV